MVPSVKFQVSRRTDVALQALRIVSSAEATVSGAALAEECGTSQAYLSQCLAPMISAGWLTSRTGPDGGYSAMPVAREVSMLQFFEQLEGPLADGRCVLDGTACDATDPCALHSYWNNARDFFIDSLRRVRVVEHS